MRFETGFGPAKDDPGAVEIGLLLAELPGGEGSYAILSRDDSHFLQAAGGGEEGWVVEYHDGPDHYESSRQPLDVIIELFRGYREDRPGWRTLVQWKPIPFSRLSSGVRFGPSRPPPASGLATVGLARAALLVIGFGGGALLYVLGFVRLTRPLQLETEAAVELGGGLLLVLIGVAGFLVAKDRRTFAPVAIYLLLGGLGALGAGGYRQRAMMRLRARCAQYLAEAKDVHERRATLANGSCRDLVEGRVPP
jgi:hypothetical protein